MVAKIFVDFIGIIYQKTDKGSEFLLMKTVKFSLQFISLFLDKVLLMPKRNWNDMSDSDESSDEDQTQIDQLPKLMKKIESSPPILTKLRMACDELSLKRLQSHQKDQVWLYVPNSFFQKSDQVHNLLNQQSDIKKLFRKANIGWNVLVDYQVGKRYIEQGLGSNNIFIKFIYSNQNEERVNGKQKYGKLQKKVTYVQKCSKASFQKQQLQASKPDQIVLKDQIQSEKGEQKGEKKKTKWVQKAKTLSMQDLNGETKIYHELILPKTLSNLDEIEPKNNQDQQKGLTQALKSPMKYEQIRSPRNNEKIEARSPRKYIRKQLAHEKSLSISTEQQNILELQERGQEKQKKVSALSEISSVIHDDSGDDSQESIHKQQKKKKKSKKSKKNKTVKSDKLDNNPFSFLVK